MNFPSAVSPRALAGAALSLSDNHSRAVSASHGVRMRTAARSHNSCHCSLLSSSR
jgi:hypothetical protein